MPPEALALAVSASIYPPAVAAVIAFGRGTEVRVRVAAFVLAAAITTYAVGVVLLLVLVDLGVGARQHKAVGPGIDIALGVLLVGLAARLHRHRPPPATAPGPSRIDRYLQSTRLASLLGVTLYVLPSPIYIGAVTAIAGAKGSTSDQLLDLVAVVAVMLWMIELPMLMLVAIPGRAVGARDRVNAGFAAHGRTVAVVVSAGAAVYFVVKGLVDLLR